LLAEAILSSAVLTLGAVGEGFVGAAAVDTEVFGAGAGVGAVGIAIAAGGGAAAATAGAGGLVATTVAHTAAAPLPGVVGAVVEDDGAAGSGTDEGGREGDGSK